MVPRLVALQFEKPILVVTSIPTHGQAKNPITPVKRRKELTRSTGAESGGRTIVISFVIVLAAAYTWSSRSSDADGENGLTFLQALGYVYAALVSIQICIGHLAQGTLYFTFSTLYWSCLSQRPCPVVMRNGIIGFCECVRPGGKPTHVHCLNMYDLNGYATGSVFAVVWLFTWSLTPLTAFLRLWWTEHRQGVKKSTLRLWLFLLKYPMAIQGEGLSNGDGLAALNAFESLMYPLRPDIDLQQGPVDKAYWLEKNPKDAKSFKLHSNIHLRDFFHDKLFCHRFFEAHGAPHPHLVCEVVGDRILQRFDGESSQASTTKRLVRDHKLIWKPRYSTMGLGVEKFAYPSIEMLENDEATAARLQLAPGPEPYLIEEKIISNEYLEAAEWYRMTTIWSLEWSEPRPGYIWRSRNPSGDTRIQTNIIGGAHCVTGIEPWVGPNKTPHTVYEPRTNKTEKIHPGVEKALMRAIKLQIGMHKEIGQGIWSIGWDVMVRKKQDLSTGADLGPTSATSHDEWEPIFIEFNVNNGFFVCDHTLEELEQMAGFYANEVCLRGDASAGGTWH